MMGLFEREKIRHPLIDFSQEALKLIVNLRNKLTDNKLLYNDLEKLVFDNILERRLLLTQKFIILDKFYEMFNKCKEDENEKESEVKLLKINDVSVKINHFLWCLKFTSNFDGENITKEKLIVTKEYLDKNFFEELSFKEGAVIDINDENNKSLDIKEVGENCISKEENEIENSQCNNLCNHCIEDLLLNEPKDE